MSVVAKELSRKCELPVRALQIWVGSQHISYGMVFFDDSMVSWKRTPDDTTRLEKLEGLLESMGILKTKKAKFEVLCSAACRAYPVEPPEMERRPPPPDWNRDQGSELMCLMDQLNETYPCRRPQKFQKDKGSGGKKVESKKRRHQLRSSAYPGQVDREPRYILSG